MNNQISMRKNYEKDGVDNYYKKNSEGYINLHEEQIRKLIINNINRFRIGSILDLCCGGGEVTKVLIENGIDKVEGSDPYTYDLYKNNTDKKCMELSFKNILQGKLKKSYDIIVCSFALHLIDEKDLFSIVNELFNHTRKIIIISPHKRPFLEQINGVKLLLVDYTLTSKGKKVYLRIYERKVFK